MTTPQQTVDSPDAAAKSTYWAVMKVLPWDHILAHGYPLRCPTEGPQRFIPVFDTREQAVAWAGSDEHVAMLIPKDEKDQP